MKTLLNSAFRSLKRLAVVLLLWAGCSPLFAQEPSLPPDPKNIALFLLVGQSNMAGRAKVAEEDKQPDSRVFVLNAQDKWVCQGEPIHFDKSNAGTGPAFSFARLVADQNPGLCVGLIPCAVGGAAMTRWKPGQRAYEEAVRRAKVAMESGTLRGILWHLGEGDADNEEIASSYGQTVVEIIASFRQDLGAPDVPFLVGELGSFTYDSADTRLPFARIINEEIAAISERKLPAVGIVSSSGLQDKGDRLHFDSRSAKELGNRYFEAWAKLQNPPAK